MDLENIKLDFYEGFEGEDEIRLYANSKDVFFKPNRKTNLYGDFIEIQLKQNENGIVFFSIWDGYFLPIISEILSNIENDVLPQFIINYKTVEGWVWNNEPELIVKDEMNWFIEKIQSTILNKDDNFKNKFWNIESITNLHLYLQFVKEKDLELRISKE
ncbi:hypothetical protein GOQ30_09715 [Flavobacterium sp. TP390]|uniref:Uncharacterized protein n=1 Tax=Flavobacterium profundi TaxID=1774945 RepID=A0A6I4IIL7_9FLAO|nr:hypothetical protein [Flavobacterium profundi]MVO09434.1 hypothetical protein [Flavobacterium profundi]